MFELYVWFYSGCALTILGTIGTLIGPGVKDPLIRTLNTEVAAIGVSLIFLTYNHTIALLTFIAASVIVTMILLRAIARLEEMGAKV